jgi:hypothetical protein
MVLSIVCAFSSFNQVGAKTYYASPQGGGDGSAPENPFVIARFWDVAKAGDTLVLLDGTYAGAESMINPPKGLSGDKETSITVRAMNDGKVTIDGEGGGDILAGQSHAATFSVGAVSGMEDSADETYN